MEQLMKDEINKEMILNAEIQKQCLKSLPKKFKVRKVTNPTTQKMIDEFKQQFNKKKGDKAYLFPELKPDLIDEDLELSKIAQPLSSRDVETLTEDINTLVANYKQLETVTIPEHRRRIEELKLERDKSDTYYLRNKKRILEKEIVRYEDAIVRDTNEMKDLQQYITNFQNAITVNNETTNNYSNVKASIVSKNQLIVRDYENNIRILNEGKINLAQQPDESEDD